AETGRETPTRDVAAARPARTSDGTLSLARAFQLMAQALSELRGPVSQEALRLRMAALHGREDALLEPARFPRLLRQANDAEIADVRKVGDDDYEITGSRTGGTGLAAPSAPAALATIVGSSVEPGEQADAAEPVAEVASGTRENGQRFGVRFRRGSRGALRGGEIPLIGVVQMDAPPAEAAPVELVAVESIAPAEEAPAKAARPRRAPRKKAAKAEKPPKTPASESDTGAAPAAPAKRSRPRARKKAE
ncbi:MAG: hypothetical protein H0T50_06035, partial [Gemmatimonadales bacterium]|nr:hypothetical protein [Gemmatimonadales bacterium]